MVRSQTCPPEQEVERENSWGPDKPCCHPTLSLGMSANSTATDNPHGYPSMRTMVPPEEKKVFFLAIKLI